MPTLVDGVYHPSVCRAYLDKPCKCCGLPHALLKQTQIEGGGIELEYNCPVALQEKIVGYWKYEIRMMRNDLCPEKLARQYDYNPLKVKIAMDIYLQSETGKRKDKLLINKLIRQIASICYRKKVDRDMDEGQRKGTLFIEPPCKCCGSMEHGLLKHNENLNGDFIAKYNCPIALHEDWDKARKLEETGKKYHPCPTKLSKAINYQPHKIQQVLEMIKDQGSGVYLNRKGIENLKEITLRTCQAHQDKKQKELASIIGFTSLGLCLCLMILSTMDPVRSQL